MEPNTTTVLNGWSLFIASGLVGIILWWCWRDFKSAALPKLYRDRTFQHVTFAIVLIYFALWYAQAGVRPGLEVHFLALTTLSLMYGWRSAFVLALLVAFALTAFGPLSWSQLPSYLLISCFFPIATSYVVFLLSRAYLPRHLFVFIFVAGFFNGALTGSLHFVVNGLYQWWVGPYDWHIIYADYISLIPLLAFPEGLLNGMALAILCIFTPQWLRCFSDHDYLYDQSQKK